MDACGLPGGTRLSIETDMFQTGDEAVIDEDGYIKITGRLKDIIIRGGENIHPLDVENALLSHDDVADVSVCAVPDDFYGEAVAAFVIRRPNAKITEDEVKQWVRQTLPGHFGTYTVVRSVFFLRTDSANSAETCLLD